jgi:hypothetical protein
LRKIGQELGVAHLLEGRRTTKGNHLRINAQTYRRPHRCPSLGANLTIATWPNLFAIQSEIAQTIADQPPSQDVRGRKSRCRASAHARPGRQRSLPESNRHRADSPSHGAEREAIRLLEQAVARDPRFLRAYCALAQMHLSLYER